MPGRFNIRKHVLNYRKWIGKLSEVNRNNLQNIANDFKGRAQKKETFLHRYRGKIEFESLDKKAERLESRFHARLVKLFLVKLETVEDVKQYISEINDSAFRQISDNDFQEIVKRINDADKRKAIIEALTERGR